MYFHHFRSSTTRINTKAILDWEETISRHSQFSLDSLTGIRFSWRSALTFRGQCINSTTTKSCLLNSFNVKCEQFIRYVLLANAYWYGFAQKVCLPNLWRTIAKSSLIKSSSARVRLLLGCYCQKFGLLFFDTFNIPAESSTKLCVFPGYYARARSDERVIAIVKHVTIFFSIENDEISRSKYVKRTAGSEVR